MRTRAIPTPELTPKSKRARVSLSLFDGDSNKENVPPFRTEGSLVSPTSPPASLRRTSTEIITPSRAQAGKSSCIHVQHPNPAHHAYLCSGSVHSPTNSARDLFFPFMPAHVLFYARTCNDKSPITGRVTERETIKNFIRSSWESQSTYTSLFISGMPGTGKTALVNAVLNEVEEDHDVEVISVNCMTCHNVDALWDHLRDTLATSPSIKGSPKKIRAKLKPLLDDFLVTRKRKCLLVLDELDHIANSCRSLSAIFSLARIANTHTLTASTTLLGDDATEILTLHFGGYTSPQLLDVLKARLSPLFEPEDDQDLRKRAQKFLPMATLTFLAKKVAAQTGDVRMLFGVLRGAIDKAMSSACPSAEENPLAASVPVVTPNHILDALKAYLPSNDAPRNNVVEIVTKVRGFGLQARLVLLSMLLATKRMEALLPLAFSISSPPKTPVKRTGSMGLSSRPTGLDLAQIHSYYTSLLSRAEHSTFVPVSRSEFADLIGVLETSGLISSSTCSSVASPVLQQVQDIRIAGCRAYRRNSFAAWGSPILTAEITDPREEEVRAIWVRESARIAKDAKLRTQAKANLNRLDRGGF
ncbi:P-loop containing nucleoside triphosphate hydrolase protein [Pisolithus microcarpus]|nr:P-loop containing nucleoside triphosphate hydrolase protein [Pisolithus microcarpus]